MGIYRRDLFKLAIAGGGSTLISPSAARAASGKAMNPDRWGMLVDTTRCIGCRHCEWACKEVNGFAPGPLSDFSDTKVFDTQRRPDPTAHTVVNRFAHPEKSGKSILLCA